jgi:hypothetical protein
MLKLLSDECTSMLKLLSDEKDYISDRIARNAEKS